MVYAVAMWDLNRQDRPDADITVGIDHYSVQGAYGLALWAGDVGRLVARCAVRSSGGPSVMGSCRVVQQLHGRLDAAGEELIGQVTVCQRPGELQRAEHQSEEGERVGLSRLGVVSGRDVTRCRR